MPITVFLAWSQERSRQVALALKDWLPYVVSAKPWFSPEDIQVGKPWFGDISKALQAADTGIICVTDENQNSRWLHWEAGAIANRFRRSDPAERSYAIPYLLDCEYLTSPMSELQHCKADEEGTLRLVEALNQLLPPDDQDTREVTRKKFEKWWPELERQLTRIPPALVTPGGTAATPAGAKQAVDPVLLEILNVVQQIRGSIQESPNQEALREVMEAARKERMRRRVADALNANPSLIDTILHSKTAEPSPPPPPLPLMTTKTVLE